MISLLSFSLLALAIADFISLRRSMTRTGSVGKGGSAKKLSNNSAPLSATSSAVNTAFIVDQVRMFCLVAFYATSLPPNIEAFLRLVCVCIFFSCLSYFFLSTCPVLISTFINMIFLNFPPHLWYFFLCYDVGVYLSIALLFFYLFQ